MGRRRPFIILLGAPVLLSGILQFIGLLRQFFFIESGSGKGVKSQKVDFLNK